MQMTVQQWTSNVKEFRMTEEGHQIWVGLRELVRMVEIESWWDSNPPQLTFPCSLVKGTPVLLILHGCPFPNLLLFRQRRWAEVGTSAIVPILECVLLFIDSTIGALCPRSFEKSGSFVWVVEGWGEAGPFFSWKVVSRRGSNFVFLFNF